MEKRTGFCAFFKQAQKGLCFGGEFIKLSFRGRLPLEDIRRCLPTLVFSFVAAAFGRAMFEYSCRRFERKHPAAHTLIQDVLGDLKGEMMSQLSTISPELFVAERKYVLLSLQRAVIEASGLISTRTFLSPHPLNQR